jgi:hypothetical protein
MYSTGGSREQGIRDGVKISTPVNMATPPVRYTKIKTDDYKS